MFAINTVIRPLSTADREYSVCGNSVLRKAKVVETCARKANGNNIKIEITDHVDPGKVGKKYWVDDRYFEAVEQEYIWIDAYKGTDANMVCKGKQYRMNVEDTYPGGKTALGKVTLSIRDQEQTIQNSILYRNNPYALSLARKTAQEYADLDGLTLPLADPTGVEIILGTWIDDAILCAIAVLTAMYCFLQERQEGMIPLLFSTRQGRKATYVAKIAIVASIAAASCVLLILFRFFYAGDLGDLSRPVQTIPAFYTSPYRISVGTMLAWNLMQRITASVFVGIFMSLLCITLERSLALGAAALLTLVQVLCWQLIDSASVFAPMKYLSVPALFSGETMLGNAVFVKLLGIPVNFVYTSMFMLFGVGGAIVILAGFRYANSHKAISLPIRAMKKHHIKKLPGIFRLELTKLLWHQKASLLLFLVLALQPRFYDSFHARLNLNELHYLSAIKTVEGTYTLEKQDSLRMQQEELNTQLMQPSDPLMQDELSARLTAVEQVIALGDYLSTRKETVSYVYETGFEAMFGIHPVGARYQNPLIAIALCLMLPSLFTLDCETGIHGLINTTAGTRKLRRTKYRIAYLFATLVFLICRLPEVIFIVKAFDLSQWTAPLVSIQAFAKYPGWMPIWLAVTGLWLYRFILALLFCTTVCKTAEKMGKYIPSVLLSFVLLGAIIFCVI